MISRSARSFFHHIGVWGLLRMEMIRIKLIDLSFWSFHCPCYRHHCCQQHYQSYWCRSIAGRKLKIMLVAKTRRFKACMCVARGGGVKSIGMVIQIYLTLLTSLAIAWWLEAWISPWLEIWTTGWLDMEDNSDLFPIVRRPAISGCVLSVLRLLQADYVPQQGLMQSYE